MLVLVVDDDGSLHLPVGCFLSKFKLIPNVVFNLIFSQCIFTNSGQWAGQGFCGDNGRCWKGSAGIGRVGRCGLDTANSVPWTQLAALALFSSLRSLHQIVESERILALVRFTQQWCIYLRASRRLVSNLVIFVSTVGASFPSFFPQNCIFYFIFFKGRSTGDILLSAGRR